jgi:quercetin dioxygenase-like cupin family protein
MTSTHRPQTGPLRWREVDLLEYKRDGSAPFRAVTRQVLFDDPSLACNLRYFEVAPGGHTTLERHQHAHAVVIQRGAGHCLVGTQIHRVAAFDLVHVPPMTWHQFKADGGEPLGFLCMVNAERDRPQLPDPDAIAKLRADPAIAAFIAT